MNGCFLDLVIFLFVAQKVDAGGRLRFRSGSFVMPT